MTEYAELHCHSYFSLLDGASSPEALVGAAQAMGLRALALTDHDSLAGAVRFVTAAQRAGLHAILGAEVTLADGHHLTLLAETQQGYANLCRLITASRLGTPPQPSPEWGGSDGGEMGELVSPSTRGRVGGGVTPPQPSPEWGEDLWPGKVQPALAWEQLAAHSAGLVCLTGCRRGPVAAALLAGQPEVAAAVLQRLRDWFGPDRLFVEIQRHYLPGEETLVRGLVGLAHVWGLPLVATNNVHYAARESSRLRDALLAIDHNETLTAARRAGRLPLNDNYALAGPAEMARRFADLPQALANSVALAERCQVSLDFSGRRLPAFPTPDGLSEFAYLYELCHASLSRRYPELKPLVLKQLAHELAVIDKAGLAGYFLIVWDIVRFARQQQIRCQGRGSAANSIVAYLLQITSIDPLRHNLLFERFLSSDRFTMPDIDIDFAAEPRSGCASRRATSATREEVIQYVYRRYGQAHAAMVCNVVTFQARSALRDLAKVLDFPPPVIERLARGLESQSPNAAAERLLGQVEPDAPAHHPLRLLAGLLGQIEGCPRHLSIHSGGMLITGPPLSEIVPLEPATMPGRVVAQWDKESVEDAGLIKLDLLGLRMLGLLSEAVGYVRQAEGEAPDLDALSLDDPAIYALLQRGDTIGAFQVESRAQQQMAPRLRPTCFEEIIVQIAIIRPGPIQGGAVHPYLRRRAGLEPVSYPHPCLEPVLAETYGALLFQEQAIRVAVAAAGFSAGEADLLRRALSRTRAPAELQAMEARFLAGAGQQGIDGETAGAIWRLLAGFAGYGFPKSHAASFALIAYQSLYLKHYHPAAFYCALLNQQPMGFYSSEVVVGDARRHGVTLLPPDIQASDWRYTLAQTAAGRPALRMGLCAVKELGEAGWRRIEAARQAQPFAGLADFCRRTRLPRDGVTSLIRAGAFDGFGERRRLLWELGGVEYEGAGLELAAPEETPDLPALAPLEQTAWAYELLGLAPGGQVMAHYREELRRAGVLSTWQVKAAEAGRRVRVAGLVVVRQRPQTAQGILFLSLEDESGLLDVVVKPAVYSRLRATLRHEPLLLVEGVVQRAGGATSLLAQQAQPLG